MKIRKELCKLIEKGKKTAVRRIAGTILMVWVSLSLSLPVLAAPEQENGRWYYRNEAGERIKNEFISIDGSRYYFGTDGALVTDAPVEYDGNRYYSSESGKILCGQWKKCIYPGETEERWHYYLGNGKAYETGWLLIGNARYHFTGSHMDSGWYSEETANGREAVWYLGTENDGKAAVGWLAWKGDGKDTFMSRPAGWYYFRENGQMVCDQEQKIGNDTYAFNGNGTMAAGFCRVTEENGSVREKYYDRKTGCRAEGWLYLKEENGKEDGWYWFSEGEVSAPSKCTKKISDQFGASLIDGNWYGFDGNGKMITGLYACAGRYYYFGTDGRMRTGTVAVPADETDAPGDQMLFLAEGSAPPSLGASAEGVVNGFLYKSGCRICAEEENYEQVVVENGKISQSYVVNGSGKVIRSGTVTQKNGKKMRIVRQEDGWKLVSLTD